MKKNMYLIFFISRLVLTTYRNKHSQKKLKPYFYKTKTELSTDRLAKDTVFILGSGESINFLEAHKWKDISDNDSIGFNFWPIHEFIPTYFTFELPRDKDRRKIFFEILEIQKKN